MINWKLKAFNELTPYELYTIMQLRNAVFVVEQNCVFQDADNKDQSSYHLMGWQENSLVAYTRLLPKGLSYNNYPSIGRVVTSPLVRNTGIGKKLMEVSINKLYELYGQMPIKIGAQLYLKNFYEGFGFIATEHEYMEDGIPHVEMIKQS